jgi:hypothetical protein
VRGGRAVLASAAEHYVVAGDRVARSSFDSPKRAFELVVGEGFDLAAVVADEVVVVLAVAVDRFETRGAGSDVDALHEAVSGELLEGAVDACDADTSAFAAELVEDLLRGEAAVLAAEKFDHRAARAAASVTA